MKNVIFVRNLIISFVLVFCFMFYGAEKVIAVNESNVNQSMIDDGGGASQSTTADESDDSKISWLSSEKVTCGAVNNIPKKVPEIVSMLILLFQIVTPVMIVIFGMIDLTKGVMSQKEDEIKKGRQTFIKRLITGAAIFFIVAFVKLLIGVVGDTSSNKESIVSCINCFINGDCEDYVEFEGGGSETPTPGGGTSNSPNINYKAY